MEGRAVKGARGALDAGVPVCCYPNPLEDDGRTFSKTPFFYLILAGYGGEFGISVSKRVENLFLCFFFFE